MESFETGSPSQESAEAAAERKLEVLLNDPNNAFLTEHPEHMEAIDDASTAVEAFAIAEALIMKRLEATFRFRPVREVEWAETGALNVHNVKETIDWIKANQEEIGRGGDAFVVIAKNEVAELPPEICYKFAMAEQTPRGRNPMTGELKLQSDFFQLAKELQDSCIAVPEPYYLTELGSDKLIAMEKLPAKSVDDILRGYGSLPSWFDIDEFCEELQQFLDVAHDRGLYHRDMHVGNVMIRQSAEVPEDGKWGYVIDFGLSGHGMQNLDPYRKEVAGTNFTYSKDDVIVEQVRKALHDYRAREV